MISFKDYLYEETLHDYAHRAAVHSKQASAHFTFAKRSKDKDEAERHHEAGHLHKKLAAHYDKMNKKFWKMAGAA